jgi:hypothetical protein
MKRDSSAVVLITIASAVSCGGTVVVEVGPNPWGAGPGEAGALPPSGTSPSDPPWTEDNDAWSGWWIRFPCYHDCSPSDVVTSGGDVVLVGTAHVTDLDLGTGPLAPEVPPGDTVGFIARVSGNGDLEWASHLGPSGGPDVAIDAASFIHVTGVFGLRTFTPHGDVLHDRTFGSSTYVDDVAPTADGGLVLGLRVEGELTFEGESVDLVNAAPSGVLLRLDAQGEPIWWREVMGAHGFVGVGEDGAGHVVAVTTGGAYADWGDILLDSGQTDHTAYAAWFDPAGSTLWGTIVSGIHSSPYAVPASNNGLLFAGAAMNALTVGAEDVPYGDPPGYEDKGVVLRLDGSGTLDSYLSFGPGPYSAASGPEALIVASSMNADPLRLLWCAEGVAPCDAYTLAETEAYGDLVAVNAEGANAYMTGLFRLTPGGSLGETSQLYLMKLGQ